MKMGFRFATDNDLDRLAEWNHQLIRDEGHRNTMAIPELRDRMNGWLASEYKDVLFRLESDSVACALYKENVSEVYLRLFFVGRRRINKGVGRGTVDILRNQVWPRH